MSTRASLAGLIIVIGSIVPVAANAQGERCIRPDISTCPLLYAEDCRDPTFRVSTPEVQLSCISVLAGDAADAASCAEFDPAACIAVDCSDPALEPIAKFFCEQGHPECPTKLAILEQDFQTTLDTLVDMIEPYQQLIDIEPVTIGSNELLCGYTNEFIGELQQQATEDQQELVPQRDRLDGLRTCSALFPRFFAEVGLVGISPALIATNMTDLDRRMEDVETQQGQIEASINSIEASPEKIEALRQSHSIFCP